jgi:anaphase-promoting complex subunit 8
MKTWICTLLNQINTLRYSNILYIKENFGSLAYLAYRTFHNDKYRPETCCVIGNYFSLRGDHPKVDL